MKRFDWAYKRPKSIAPPSKRGFPIDPIAAISFTASSAAALPTPLLLRHGFRIELRNFSHRRLPSRRKLHQSRVAGPCPVLCFGPIASAF